MRRGFWTIALARFRRDRTARLAGALLALLLVLAALAPLIANRWPLGAVLDGAVSFPAFRAFDTEDVLWLGGLVVAAGLFLLRRRARRARWVVAAALASVTLALAGGAEPANLAVTDWRGLEETPGNTLLWAPIPHGPHSQDRDVELAAPFEVAGHPFGTDALGRDLFARLLFGARVSFLVGLLAAGISTLLGTAIGGVAGFWRGRTDTFLSWIIQVFMCFPVVVLILAASAWLPPSLVWVMILIGLTSWTGAARLMRGEAMRLREQQFVEAARALGAGKMRILARHVLPNALAPMLVHATLAVAGAILLESTLSFLGLGPPDSLSWGALLRQGREVLPRAGHLVLFPGLALFVTVAALNLLGEALRDATDPRLLEERR